MNSTSFSTFLRDHARRTDDPTGDFIEDAREDIGRGTFPTSSAWSAIEWHLIARNACSEAMGAARAAYRRYRVWLAARD